MNTKELIIQNSFLLFLAKGYKEVSLNEILKDCGVSKGAFYHHFKSKDELYEKVLDRFFFSYFSKHDVDYTSNSIDNKITYIIEMFLSPYREIANLLGEKHVSGYFRFLFQVINTFPEIRARVNRHFYIKGYYIYQLINLAKDNGEIEENVESKLVARQILSTFIGVLVLEGIYDISNIELRFKEVVEGYLTLIKK